MHMNNGCVNKKVDVFMDKSVVQKINSLIHRDLFHECGGIFIGNVSVDQVTGKHTVHIHDLYFEERLGTGSTFEFTTDYLMNAVKYVKKNCPEYHIVGNIHLPIRLYSEDRADYHRKKHEKERQENAKLAQFSPGTIIEHPRFGHGVVLSSDGSDSSRILQVAFSTVGQKALSASWVLNNCQSKSIDKERLTIKSQPRK